MAGETLDVTSRTYHTVDGVPHAEGETYSVADRWMAETLVGCGFVSIVGWTPPPDPPITRADDDRQEPARKRR
jgi:hypothetical protein